MKKITIKAHKRGFNAAKLPPRTKKGTFTKKGARQQKLFR